jgi:regulator of protease activity HflC (stomatin/prohibitin superfamily)
MYIRTHIRDHELSLRFDGGQLVGILEPGRHVTPNLLGRVAIRVYDRLAPWLEHADLAAMVKTGVLDERVRVLDLADHERAVVTIDGRIERVLMPGLYALFTDLRDVQVELYDVREGRLEHDSLTAILGSASVLRGVDLESLLVAQGHVGLVYRDGRLDEQLGPGRYALWRGAVSLRLLLVDLRQTQTDVAGQELMTKDRVTLRLNAIVTWRVEDAVLAQSAAQDATQALYRAAQLALRGLVGTRTLDQLLTDKESAAAELEATLKDRARGLGLAVVAFGIRDVILPGDMKELLNKVTEARKAAEAAVITRREETAAMRSQANTAKLLADNPTLMRLRVLEVLTKVAEESSLTVVLGNEGLADKVLTML